MPAQLVLASASPRRVELLQRIDVDSLQRPANVDETPRPGEVPARLVRRLAVAKARAVARRGDVVLGADTVVALDGEILGKPTDPVDAARMLRRLAGREHVVVGGVAVVAANGRVASAVERTRVRFRILSDREIDAYVATGEPLDKAGAYGIQGRAEVFVTGISGSYSNVVGLPLATTVRLLREAGFDI